MSARTLREYRPAARADGARQPTLVACPHAGGSASFFASWRTVLPAGWGLSALRYPGREDRLAQPMPTALEDLADAALDEVAEIDGPIVLFGHSMGASVAYELALRLDRIGRTPELLVVSARRPSHRLHDRGRERRRTDDEIAEHLRELSPEMSAFLDEPELRALVMPAVTGDYELVRTYGPTEPRRVRAGILALSGATDAGAPSARMSGWADLTDGGFAAREFEGGHFYLVGRERAVIDAIVARMPMEQPA